MKTNNDLQKISLSNDPREKGSPHKPTIYIQNESNLGGQDYNEKIVHPEKTEILPDFYSPDVITAENEQ